MKIKNIGYLILIVGIILTGYKYVSERQELVIEQNKVAYSLEEQTGYLTKDVDTYDAILSIPKINLKKGLYQKEDIRNNIDSNIAFHELSSYPDLDNGNVILMAHSGSGKTAFFNDLDKLDTDSLVEFYYQKTKYIYKIDNYYTIDKTGLASIKRDINKKTITLITCSQSDKTKQLIYIGYLIDKVKY